VKPSLFQRMDLWARELLPLITTLGLLLLSLTPTHVPGWAGVAPVLTMMAVYYWAIYRPDLLSPLVAFAIGVLQDVLAGTPLGVNALVLLLIQGATASQRRFFLGNTFAVAWWGFALVAFAAVVLAWLLASVVYGQLLQVRAVMFQYLLTLSLYPVVSWGLAKTQAALMRQA